MNSKGSRPVNHGLFVDPTPRLPLELALANDLGSRLPPKTQIPDSKPALDPICSENEGQDVAVGHLPKAEKEGVCANSEQSTSASSSNFVPANVMDGRHAGAILMEYDTLVGGLSGVEATRVLAEEFGRGNHLQTYSSSVYQKAKFTMSCWLERLASGPSPRGAGH
ncbi:hypothetical protein V6N11_018627 [Hibiscus sabdariffa]|uniref:Uncharacterized protein n=1 Tax=Hibiscus sabdariffa TaxID=183260 RepID=A0ABR2N8F2_9ROSI